MGQSISPKDRLPGRPRAIPDEVVPVALELYRHGYGYRAIAGVLRDPEYGLNPHYSSVRRVLVRMGKVGTR